MKYKILANILFLSHVGVVLIILFGWAFPALSIIYLATLILTLASEAVLGYCPLTKWEFDFRKKLEPSLNYDYSFLNYYGFKLLGNKFRTKIVRPAALIFLLGSIIMYIWNR